MSPRPTHTQLEDLVERFLDRREREPGLTPEAFAAEHAAVGPGLLAALHASLAVLATLDQAADPLPERIGPFRVIRELGRGGMGVVYEVERDGVRHALKRLGVTGLLQPHAQQRFQREARALLRLRHPGVVAVHEVGAADGLPFLVMDLVSGRSLEDLGPMPWRRAAELCRDIGRALQAVHDAGLCHRDLKPQNVLLRPDDSPVIVDFGLVHDAGDTTLTGTGDLLGTPRYLAPEQAAGQPTDTRTDVYALGLILAELLTGAPARAGTERSALLAAAAAGAVPSLRGVPQALRRVVRTATALRPRWRYGSAAELVADLERVLVGEPVRAQPPGPLRRGVDLLGRRPRLATALAAALVAVVAGGAWLALEAGAAARRARADAHFEGAVFAWCQGSPQEVAPALAATLAEDPSHAGAAVLAALQEGRTPTAAAASTRPSPAGVTAYLQQEWSTATAALRETVQTDPSCPLLRILLARAAEQGGSAADAESELAAATRLLPDSAALAWELGALRYRGRRFQDAAVEFERGATLRPDAPWLRYWLARCCLQFDAERGLLAIDAALAMPAPAGPALDQKARLLRAALLDKLGRSGDAIVILQALADETPDDPDVCYSLAYALDRQLRVREARPYYEKVLERQPAHTNAALCLVWLLTTAAEEDLRDLDQAEQLLVAQLERTGGRSEAVLQMTREFGLRSGRIAALLAALERLMESPATTSHLRGTLEHTRNYLRNGAPREGR